MTIVSVPPVSSVASTVPVAAIDSAKAARPSRTAPKRSGIRPMKAAANNKLTTSSDKPSAI